MDDLKKMVLQRKLNAAKSEVKGKGKTRKNKPRRKHQNFQRRKFQNQINRGRKETELKQLELNAPKGLTFKQRKALRQAPKLEENHLKSMFNKGQLQDEFIYNGRPVNGPYVPPYVPPPVPAPVTYGLDQEYSPPYDPVQAARDRTQKELSGMGNMAVRYQTMFHGDETKSPLYNPQMPDSPNKSPPYMPSETDFYQSDSPMFSLNKPKEKKRPPPVRRSARAPQPVQRLEITEPRPRPKPKTRKVKPASTNQGSKPEPVAPSGNTPKRPKPRPRTRKTKNMP
jgi:hypothetical protein